jgi:LacI family transcriptional regulator
LARPGRVSAVTAERIREAAARLGYHTNPLARALPTGRTKMIAVIISDITNPFYFGIIRGAQAAAADADYTMMLADAQESDEREREAMDRALPIVEGIVVASSRMSDTAIRMAARQKPLLLLNRVIADVPCLLTDNPAGVRKAAEHLAALGHRSITYIAGPEASWADGVRWRALLAVTAELGLRSRRVGPFPPTVAGGEKAADTLLQRHTTATAALAYNDQVAIGLIRRLTAHGVGVPDQISVVGIDNIFAADLITPPLTTVAAPLGTMGHTAVRNVLAMNNGAQSRAAEPLILPVELVTRASTAPPPRPSRSARTKPT